MFRVESSFLGETTSQSVLRLESSTAVENTWNGARLRAREIEYDRSDIFLRTDQSVHPSANVRGPRRTERTVDWETVSPR